MFKFFLGFTLLFKYVIPITAVIIIVFICILCVVDVQRKCNLLRKYGYIRHDDPYTPYWYKPGQPEHISEPGINTDYKQLKEKLENLKQEAEE